MMPCTHGAELDRLKRLHDASTEGVGQLVLVSGGLGVGKTELLRAFGRHAADSGSLVLRATGSRAEQNVQGGVIEQLLFGSTLPDGFTERARELRIEAAPYGGGQDDAAAEQARHAEARMLRGLCPLLRDLAAERTVVLMVDDLQFADTTSLNLLLWLQRRLDGVRMLAVLAQWDRRDSELPLFHAELARLPHTAIRLAAMTEAQVAEALAALATHDQHPDRHRDPSAEPGRGMPSANSAASAAAADARAFHEASGGNMVLLKALVDDRRAGGGPVAGPAFAQAVLCLLHAWDLRLLQVAQALVLLGPDATDARLARLAGLDGSVVAQSLRTLTEAGLLADGRLRSDAAAAAVQGSIAPAECSRLHVRAAELLYEDGAASIPVADHLLAADLLTSEPGAAGRRPGGWCVPVLREAAEQALAEDAASLAVRYLEVALAADSGGTERASVVEALVRARWRLNPAATMVHSGQLQQALREGRLTGSETVTLIRQALWRGDAEVAADGLALLNRRDSMLDRQTVAAVRLAAQWFYGPAFGSPEPSPAAGGDRAALGDNPWTRVAADLARCWAHGGVAPTGASAEQILQSCGLHDNMLEAVATALLALAQGVKADRAAALCEQLTEEAERRGAPTWQGLLHAVRADIALRRGEMATAVSHAETALDVLPPQHWGVLIGHPLAVLIQANTALGRLQAAGQALRHVVPDALFGTVHGLRYLHARGRYLLESDRVLVALDDFEACAALLRERTLDLTALLPLQSDLAEANLRLGRRQIAVGLARQQLDRCRPGDVRTRGRALRVLAQCVERAQRRRLLTEAVECLEASGDRFEHARALADLSESYQESGEFDRARETSRRATQETKVCQTPTNVPMARRPRRIEKAPAAATITTTTAVPAARKSPEGSPADRGVGLSEAERKVATLAALGHTNRAIGRRLYITVSTVEQHLTKVYRKLGVNSRSDLPASLAVFGMPESSLGA